jgi:hypothetical protein
MLTAISLADLAAQSDVVVIAHPADPPTTTRHIDITPAGQAPQPQKWPPYVWTDARYVVDDVLFDGNRFGVPPAADAAVLAVGKTIVVEGATTASTLALHRSYYVDGESESPIYESYRAAGTTASKSRVLFLRRHGSGFLETVVGAVEWVEHRELVVAALRAGPTSTPPTLMPSTPSTPSSKKP